MEMRYRPSRVLKRSSSNFGSCPVAKSDWALERTGGSTSSYPREPRSCAPQYREARARELDAPLEVEDAESGTEIPVRHGSEIEFSRLAPRAFQAIGGLVLSTRDGRVGNVGDAALRLGELVLPRLHFRLERPDLVLERLHLVEHGGIRLAADGGDLVAPAALLLELRHALAPLAVERHEGLHSRAAVALGELAEEVLGALSQTLAC